MRFEYTMTRQIFKIVKMKRKKKKFVYSYFCFVKWFCSSVGGDWSSSTDELLLLISSEGLYSTSSSSSEDDKLSFSSDNFGVDWCSSSV